MAERVAPRFRWATGFAALYLAASMGALAVLLVPGNAEGADNGVFIAAWSLLYVVTAWQWLRARLPLSRSGVVLLAFAAWTMVTALWSPQPASTALYGLALTSNVLFILWATARLGLPALLRIALATTAVLALAGVVLSLVGVEAVRYVDVHGRSTLVGTEPLRGLFNHKITAGTFATIAAVLAWYLTRGPARTVLILGLVAFVVLTGSTGALVLILIAAAVVAFLALARRLRLGPGVVAAAVAAAAGLGTVAAAWLAPPLLEAIGRDGSLTGRIDLWSWGLSVAIERPIVGWGFFGYAGSERAALDAAAIPRFATYAVPHFHNAYLQGFVDLGVVGSLFAPTVAFVALYVHGRRGLATGDRFSLAITAAVIVVLAAGLGMHAFVQYNHYQTLMLLAAFAAVRLT